MMHKPVMGRRPDPHRAFQLLKLSGEEQTKPLPSSYSITDTFGVRPNQTTYGVCVAESSTTAVQAETFRHNPKGLIPMSVSAIYAQALQDLAGPGQPISDSGLPTAAGLTCFKMHGYVPSLKRPFPQPNDEASMLAPVDPAYWVRSFENWTFAAVDPSIEAIKRALPHGPIQIGTSWANSWFNPDADGFLPPPDTSAGGHAITIGGYDDKMACFIIANSWGVNWGVKPEGAASGGWYYLPYSFATDYPDFWPTDLYVVSINTAA